jgi:hypothetical protein
MKQNLEIFNLDEKLQDILDAALSLTIPESRQHLLKLATNDGRDTFEVAYEVDGKGLVQEATVVSCQNGVAVNYNESYMRRREPDCMFIGDSKPTDKNNYKDRFGTDFDSIRNETFEWLKQEDLIMMPFVSGDEKQGGDESLIVAPKNAAFFVAGLADLQGFIPYDEIRSGFTPKVVIYLAPTFRHTHFDGKQVVVHNRLDDVHEVFSFNLYPGPSAKKGIYGVLLTIGEREKWLTAHASSVKAVTNSGSEIVIMHEGASGGGKSEMIEQIHREDNGDILLAYDESTDQRVTLKLDDIASLNPVTDDMALCHPSIQKGKKLVISDAESGWFLRFNHITEYGTSPEHEKLTIHPPEPLIFLNMQGVPGGRILIWDHTYDEPGVRCPNPRVIMPRHFMKNVVNDPVEVEVRSFGVRMPKATREVPTYGVAGMLHVLPPALAWIWRLVSPRGHANPSIVETQGMSSEGVGSYWPFATGKRVTHANLLLDQIRNTPETRYVLIPNQNIGTYEIGFMGEWLDREYLARRGNGQFAQEELVEARCKTFGYALKEFEINGFKVPIELLQTELQEGLGIEAYDKGAEILTNFFKKELKQFLSPELEESGRKIIEAYLNDQPLSVFEKLL